MHILGMSDTMWDIKDEVAPVTGNQGHLPACHLPPSPTNTTLWISFQCNGVPKFTVYIFFQDKSIAYCVIIVGQDARSTLLYHVSLWYLGAETDDQQRNPNIKNKDHLVGD